MNIHEKANQIFEKMHGPGAFFIRRPRIAALAGIILSVWGILSTFAIPKESSPYIQFGVVVISTAYPGASAEDVDALVTREIESKIKNVSGIDSYSSLSQNGISQITVNFTPEASQNMTKSVGDIRSKVDEAKPFLPAEIDSDPRILEIDSSVEPFLSVVVSGEKSLMELTDDAERLRESLENLSEVARAEVVGGVEREIRVAVDREKLESFQLSLESVSSAIRLSHRDTPVGNFEVDSLEYSLRFAGKHRSAEDIASVILKDLKTNGETSSFLRVRDVAEVSEVPADKNAISRFSALQKTISTPLSFSQKFSEFTESMRSDFTAGKIVWLLTFGILLLTFLFPPKVRSCALPRYIPFFLGSFFFLFSVFLFSAPPQYSDTNQVFENAISLSVSRKSGSDILSAREKTISEAKAFFANDSSVTVDFMQDAGEIMRQDYWGVLVSGAQSIAVVLLFLFLFVGIREGLIASLVIPLSFLVTIGVLSALGQTLNFMTNFSMILALGILVDTAIVIVEGVHHYIKKGYTSREAAFLSLSEFRSPLISGTLTTLAVFVPLLTLSGILGQFLKFIPVTVIIILSVSLLLSLLLLPSYAAHLLDVSQKSEQSVKKESKIRLFFHAFRERFEEKMSGIIAQYVRILRWILATRARRLGIFIIPLAFFFATTFLPIKFILFPAGDQPFISLSLEMPEGTTEQKTLESTLPLEQKILDFPEIKSIKTTVSGKTANISLELLPTKDREEIGLLDSQALEKVLNKTLDKIPRERGASIRVVAAQSGPPSDSPVAFRVVARDRTKIPEAQKITTELTEKLKKIPGTAGVKNNIEKIPGEFQFRILRDRAISLGINPDTAAATVRTAISGTTAATLTRNNRDIDVVVEVPEEKIASLTDLQNFAFFAPNGKKILLSQISEFESRDALAAVRREEGSLTFTISSFLGDNGNAAEITDVFLKELESFSVPEGIEIKDAGENEQNADLFVDLSRGYVIAIFLMFLVLVVQFDRFLQPLLILFTILLAQIGVQFGLWITDTPKSLAYILGTIALAGVVVNDAIILVDRMNHNRIRRRAHESEKEMTEAVVESGESRFIPVILTTLTTIAGILPLVFQDVFWAGLSYTIMFGLGVASTMTLLVTPAMYFQFEREQGRTFIFLAFALFVILSFFQLAKMNFPMVGFFAVLALIFGIWYQFWKRKEDHKKQDPLVFSEK